MSRTLRKSDWRASWSRFIRALGCRPRTRDEASESDRFLHRDGTGKGPGFEYWSRRPCNGWGPGSDTKRITNRLERRRAKQALREEYGDA